MNDDYGLKQSSPQEVTSKNYFSLLFIIISFLLGLALGSWIYRDASQAVNSPEDQLFALPKISATYSPSLSQMPAYCEKYYSGITDTAWVNYHGEQFSFQLPSGVMIAEDRNPWVIDDPSQVIEGVSVWKEGPTQRHETEHYDGLSLNILYLPKNNLTLKTIAATNLKELLESDPDSASSLSPVTIASYVGWTFRYHPYNGLTYTYLEVSEGSDNYLLIIDGTMDPAEQGFSSIATQILSSLTFLD